MTVKLLTEHHLEFLSLKGGCTGSFASTLVKMPHCWKSHVTAHMMFLFPVRHLLVFPISANLNAQYQMVLGNTVVAPVAEVKAGVWSC